MSRPQSAVPRSGADDTKEQIKLAAQALFARHGVDAVTVQQIVSAAGQRNNAALHYHFGTKEELVRQLVVEGAERIDVRRRAMLDALEARGGPSSVRDVLYALVTPVIELGNEERWRGYVRFTSQLQMANRELLRSALANRWNAGYVSCRAHLRTLLHAVPAPLLEQRLSFMGIYANAVLSAREAALEVRRADPHHLWHRSYTVENIVDTLEAVLSCPASSSSLEALEQSESTVSVLSARASQPT